VKLRHCLNRPGCRCGLLHAPVRCVPKSPDPVFGFGVYRDGELERDDEDEPTLPSARHPHVKLELPVMPWWRSLLGLFALE